MQGLSIILSLLYIPTKSTPHIYQIPHKNKVMDASNFLYVSYTESEMLIFEPKFLNESYTYTSPLWSHLQQLHDIHEPHQQSH